MRRSVLIVEDDPAIAEVLGLVLEDAGYAVAAAAAGRAALAHLERGRPDLVLLDLMLPRLDGAGLVAELEARGLRAGLPILVLSAAGGAEERAARLGADAFLGKPFDLDALLGLLDRLALRPAPARTG